MFPKLSLNTPISARSSDDIKSGTIQTRYFREKRSSLERNIPKSITSKPEMIRPESKIQAAPLSMFRTLDMLPKSLRVLLNQLNQGETKIAAEIEEYAITTAEIPR